MWRDSAAPAYGKRNNLAQMFAFWMNEAFRRSMFGLLKSEPSREEWRHIKFPQDFLKIMPFLSLNSSYWSLSSVSRSCVPACQIAIGCMIQPLILQHRKAMTYYVFMLLFRRLAKFCRVFTLPMLKNSTSSWWSCSCPFLFCCSTT